MVRNEIQKDVDYYAKYYLENKDKISQNKKEYYQNNKEYFINYGKQYRIENLETLKEYDKIKMTCECGKIICKRTYNKHSLTKKHIEKMEKK